MGSLIKIVLFVLGLIATWSMLIGSLRPFQKGTPGSALFYQKLQYRWISALVIFCIIVGMKNLGL